MSSVRRMLLSLTCLALIAGPALGENAQPSHGELQVQRILKDRPDIGPSLEIRPSLREWIVARFESARPPLFWNADPPISGRAAEFDARDPERTYVRVSKKPSGIDQLSSLIFELHNVMGYEVFDEIHEKALRGEVGRDEYAKLALEQEMVALRAARKFIHRELGELTRAEEREASLYYKKLSGPDTLEERIADGLERGYDLRDHYRELYDEYVVPEREP